MIFMISLDLNSTLTLKSCCNMAAMHRPLLVLAFLVALFHCDVAQQIQMPEAGALHLPDEELSTQVLTLQKNVSELWTYIFQLRSAVTQHLNHLRQHQVELEDVVHRMSHSHEGHGEGTSAAHTDDHHHSGEHHSHSNEQHSHGDDQHSHSGEHHSHGDDHHHSEEHSHGGGDHSHGSHDHYHDSHSHSHSHSHEGHGSHSSHEVDSHHHGHGDSHETEDLQQSQQGADLQQVQQGSGPVLEPVIVPSVSRSHHSHGTPGSSSFTPLPLMNNYHHHHHHHEPRRNRSRVVVLPKYSEYDLYEFAVCNVQPNRAIPADQQQEITGQVTLWQKKMGGSLNLHVRLQGFNMGDHHGHHQQTVQQEDDNVTPAPNAHKHGFHVHTSGDLSNGCQSTGSHYNPKNANHGGPNSLVRHVGDLGNIECDEHGIANIVFSDNVASLKGPYSIIGKAIVIHALNDDYGLGGNEESLKTGNAGTRLACCVIEKVDKLPIRSYKAIKTAKQYQN